MIFLGFLITISLTAAIPTSRPHSEAENVAKEIDSVYLTSPSEMIFIDGLNNTKIAAGNSIFLECRIRSKPSATISWTFNGSVIRGPFDMSFEDKILNIGKPIVESVVVTSIYEIPCASPKHSGIYACTATNTHQALESTAQIIVDNNQAACKETKPALPKIIEWTELRLEMQANVAALRCRAENTEKVEWSFEGKTLQASEKHQMTDEGVLLVRNVSFASDLGAYICVARNQFGKDSEEAVLYPSKKMPLN